MNKLDEMLAAKELYDSRCTEIGNLLYSVKEGMVWETEREYLLSEYYDICYKLLELNYHINNYHLTMREDSPAGP